MANWKYFPRLYDHPPYSSHNLSYASKLSEGCLAKPAEA
jgi:hypothetical protein